MRFVATNPPAWADAGPAIAAGRADAAGLLNLVGVNSREERERELDRLIEHGRGCLGIKLPCREWALILAKSLPRNLRFLVVSDPDPSFFDRFVEALSDDSVRVLAEVTDVAQAQALPFSTCSGWIAKGNEAGGRIGEETTFILLQRLLRESNCPVWAHGGIGVHSAAACLAGGASGVVLEGALLLARESSLPERVREVIARLGGDETRSLGLSGGDQYRFLAGVGTDLSDLESETVLLSDTHESDAVDGWRIGIESRIGWSTGQLWPLGQDASFAASFSERFQTVGRMINGLRKLTESHLHSARESRPLAEGSPLALEHGTRYPLVQGPMTRVCDTAPFAAAVAEAGGLPFVALAMLKPGPVEDLLRATLLALGNKPWGVGILGFVPPELRKQQLEVARRYNPLFALIAGGRPDQAVELEQQGISTYLHVPSPALLRAFLQRGARRFVFEGRECGGHVGPRSSFVLWDSMIQVLAEEIDSGRPADELCVLFAGGIHDARSSAMVAAMAAPLAERGVRIGALMGSAYLFTKEAVETQAIVEGFQRVAIEARSTVLVESGTGHAIRCADTPFFEHFQKEKRRLTESDATYDEVKGSLEKLELGRLRIASKGIVRVESAGESQPRYSGASGQAQYKEGMYMIGQLASMQSKIVSIADLHREVSVTGSSLLEKMPAPTPIRSRGEPERPLEIAIVGLGCLLPGASDPGRFWFNVLQKVDLVGEIPRDRFNWELYFDADRKSRDKIYSRWGGFLADVRFDPMRYGIPPKALSSIDPLQLLTLEVVRRTLENSGYAEHDFDRRRAGVILGAGGGLGDLGMQYGFRSYLPLYGASQDSDVFDRLPEWTEDSFAGILLNVAAGRVANRFDFGGVNFTVDAACASSLAAVYLACRELVNGSADLMLAGGIDTVQSPFGFLCFSKTQALSATGRCRTFDAEADGIAISEGLAVMALKRLTDAERDGDRIYAVLRGVQSSSDGRDKSLTAPRPAGQVLCLNRAYEQAGFSPSTVGLIEAHGTGTVAGDGAEIAALSTVFRKSGAEARSCALGSVKSMIGHTKSAAGVAGLLKIALAAYHKIIPPTINVDNPNPRLKEEGSPFFISRDARPWVRSVDGTPRRAGVSAFGFGGTNFHAVIEEYQGSFLESPASPVREWPRELFTWSARSAEALSDSLQGWIDGTRSAENSTLAELAATKNRCELFETSEQPLRLALVASSRDDLLEKIAKALQKLRSGFESPFLDSAGIFMASEPAKPGRLAFLFAGQGSQYPDMLRELALHFTELRESLEFANQVAYPYLNSRLLSDFIYPPYTFDEELTREQVELLKDTAIAQPALGAIELGLLRLLQRLGIKPDMTAGHSYGEYVALHAANVMDAEQLIRLSSIRGRIVARAGGKRAGSMLAVIGDAARVESAVADLDGVWVANYNNPSQTVIGGLAGDLQAAADRLRESGLPSRPVPVSCAFHTPLILSAAEELGRELESETFKTPEFAVFSNSLGGRYPNDPAQISRVLTSHLTEPVQFVREIEAIYEAGCRAFLEVGPRSVLTGCVKKTLRDPDIVAISVDSSAGRGMHDFLCCLAQLAVAGHEIRTSELFSGRVRGSASLQKLIEEGAPAEGHYWLVNGGRVKKEGEPEVRLDQHRLDFDGSKRSQVDHQDNQTLAQGSEGGVPGIAPSPAQGVPRDISAQAPLNGDGFDAGLEEVMLRHQEVMNRFLDTQKEVMTAFFGEGKRAAAESPTVAEQVDRQQFPQETVPVVRREGVPERKVDQPPAVSVPAQSEQPDTILERLQFLISEKTGYPPELIDPSANLEADLGIDSIKRVEVLSALEQSLPDKEQAVFRSSLDRLTTLKSLDEMVELLAGAYPSAQENRGEPARDLQTPSIAEGLLEIISATTGYPTEMLDPTADLEADLGIDSIKRVEILSALETASDEARRTRIQKGMDRLTKMKTIEALVSYLSEAEAGEVPVEVPGANRAKTSSAGTPDQETAVPRYSLKTIEAPMKEAPARDLSGFRVALTDDEEGTARDLAKLLTAAGAHCVLIRQGPELKQVSDDVLEVDLTSQTQVSEAINGLRDRAGAFHGLLHLSPLKTPPCWEEVDFSEWKSQVDRTVKSLYNLARAMQTSFDEVVGVSRPLLLVGTLRHQSREEPEFTPCPSHGGLLGFMWTLDAEWPDVDCRVVDLSREDRGTRAERLLTEVSFQDRFLNVIYEKGERKTTLPSFTHLNDASGEDPGGDRSDWVILLTGGARGITAQIAHDLARKFKPTLILAGRSAAPSGEEDSVTAGLKDSRDIKSHLISSMRNGGAHVNLSEIERAYGKLMREREIRHTIAELERSGARIEYCSVDVRNEEDFSSMIDHIYEKYGRLDGVVHGAGVIEDRLLADKSEESFQRVLHTKADSAFLLARKLDPTRTRFLVFMSSVTAVFGNPGQSDYGAANGILNSLADQLASKWPGRVVAINWGPWDGGGMVSNRVREQFQTRGIQIVPPREGVLAALREINSVYDDQPVVVVGDGPWRVHAIS